jgi:hypothetical protein
MTTPATPAQPAGPFSYLDDSDGGPPEYIMYVDNLPEVQVEQGTRPGTATFRTPGGALAATNISTSAGLFAAAADSLALAHAVAAYEDAERDNERQASLATVEVSA